MGGQGDTPRQSGFEGAEPLASPNVLRWVGWLPFITRCGTGPAVPASPPGDALHQRGAGGGIRRGGGFPRREPVHLVPD